MVGARDNLLRVARRVHRLHQLRGWPPGLRRECVRVVLFRPQLVELAGQSLRGASGVDEDDRGAVRHHLVVHGALDVWPDGFRGARWWGLGGVVKQKLFDVTLNHGLPNRGSILRHRQVRHVLDGDVNVQLPALLRGRIDDGGLVAQEVRHRLQRAHRGGQADALEVPRDAAQALEREREVHAALRAGQRVNLVHDHGVDSFEDARRLGSEHEVERLRCSNEDVRRLPQLAVALRLRGVARSHADGDVRHIAPYALGHAGDPAERRAQVVLHVHTQRLQRGDVENAHTAVGGGLRTVDRQGLLARALDQRVQRPEEGRERFTRAGGGDHQGVLPVRDGAPRPLLYRGRFREDLRKPGDHLGVEAVEDLRAHGCKDNGPSTAVVFEL